MSLNESPVAAAAVAAVLGVGPFRAASESPELKRELATLRRQIRTGASDRKIVLTIRRITAIRTREHRVPVWLAAKRSS